MATEQQIARDILDLKTLRDEALQSNDQKSLGNIDAQIKAKALQLRELRSQSATASPDAISDSVDRQAQAVEYLHTGAYKVPRSEKRLMGSEFEMPKEGLTSQQVESLEKSRVLQALSEATEIPADQINIDDGIPGLKRLRTGFLRDDAQIYNYLSDIYARDGGDIRKVSMDYGAEFLVQHPKLTGGQYILADEYGVSLKDVLDVTREIATTGAEIGAGVFGPGKVSVPLTALKTGVSNAVTNLAIDTILGTPDADENTFGKNLSYALTEGGKTALVDLGFGQAVKGGIRLFGDQRLGKDEVADRIAESKKALEKRFGFEFEETYGTRQNTMEALLQQEDIVSRYSSGFFAGLSRKAERARDIIYDLSRGLTNFSSKDFNALYRSFRQNQIDRTQQVVQEIANNDQILGNAISRAIAERVRALGVSGSTSSRETGSMIRNAFVELKREAKKESNRRFEEVFKMADGLGVTLNPSAVSNNIQNVVNSLDLPKDIRGEVLNIFKPRGINQVSRQADALGEQITEDLPVIYGAAGDIVAGGQRSEAAVQNLSLSQLDDWRKQVKRVINRQIQNGQDTSKLKQVEEAIDGMIDDAMERGGPKLVEAHNAAKLFFTESVVPFRAKGIADLSTKGDAQEYVLGDLQVINKFFNGDRAVENLRELKRVLGNNSPALENMRAAYLNNLMDKAVTYNGSVDYLKLNQVAFNKDVVRELYGEQAVKGFEELDELMRLNGGTKISQDLVDSMTRAKSPKDIKQILNIARDQIRREKYLERNAKKLIGKIRSGEITMEDPSDLISAVRGLKAGEAKEFLNALPEIGGIRQSFQQEYLNDLMTLAGRGSSASQKTSRKMGGRNVWDYKLMDDILTDSTRRANYEAILGKKVLKDLADLNNALKSFSRRRAAQSKLFGVLRGAPEGQGILSATIYGSFDYVKLRLLSAAFSSGTLSRVLNQAKNEEELFNNLLPYMLTTTRGIEALTYEADKDPRFHKVINKFIADQFE